MGRPKRVSNRTTKVFSERLTDLVEEAKTSGGKLQKEIAEEIGVSSGTLSEWCSDQKTPTIDAIPKIAAYFGVSADWIIGISDAKSPESSIQDIHKLTGLTEDSILTLQEVTTQPPAVKKAVYTFLNDLLDNFGFINLAIAYLRHKEGYYGDRECYAITDSTTGCYVDVIEGDISLIVMQNAFTRIVTDSCGEEFRRSTIRKDCNSLTNEEKIDFIAQEMIDLERGK